MHLNDLSNTLKDSLYWVVICQDKKDIPPDIREKATQLKHL